MFNKLLIFNLALKQLEQGRLSTIDDPSTDAESLKELLSLATSSILRETLWQNFKTTARFVKLSEEEMEEVILPRGFCYSYIKPDNCITLVFPNLDYRLAFESQMHPTKNQTIVYTKEEVDAFTFVRYCDNYKVWHAEQIECLAFKLADYLAPQYLNDANKVTRINRMLKGKIEKASVFSGQEIGEEMVDRSAPDSDFDNARFNYNNQGGFRGPGYSPSRDGFR